MPLGGILLLHSISTNLLDPVRHQVDLRNVEVSINLLGNIHFVADIILPGVQSVPLLGQCPSFNTGFVIYLSLLQEFRSQGIGFGLRIFSGSPE